MSNFLGKTLIEAKKVGSTISKSAKEVGGAVGKAACNVASYTKKSAKIAMIKAEMDQLYESLGKAVFKYGMCEENEVGLNYLKLLLEKRDELKKLEQDIESENNTCDCNEECDCSCDCECHDEDNTCNCSSEKECSEDCNCECNEDAEIQHKDAE